MIPATRLPRKGLDHSKYPQSCSTPSPYPLILKYQPFAFSTAATHCGILIECLETTWGIC
ncbi:hypothetical protein BDZ91DRAFT_714563 [Kalaharituber pfeilii]|nr:hypothetical protein BDZ91DRAFT_714563 [Kalaharituber pfeilii]